jgi:hypothetical protein
MQKGILKNYHPGRSIKLETIVYRAAAAVTLSLLFSLLDNFTIVAMYKNPDYPSTPDGFNILSDLNAWSNTFEAIICGVAPLFNYSRSIEMFKIKNCIKVLKGKQSSNNGPQSIEVQAGNQIRSVNSSDHQVPASPKAKTAAGTALETAIQCQETTEAI